MPTTEWLNKYESIKDKLTCKMTWTPILQRK